MREFCTKFGQSIETLQFLLLAVLVCHCGQAWSQVSRAPANFVPDDDQIVVPMVIEKNFVDEFHDKHKNKFRDAKKKIREWVAREEYAEAYGLEGSGVVNLPTPNQKQKFFERNYLRFISKDVERSANQTAKEIYENWNTDDEFAAIEARAESEEFVIKAKKQSGRKSHDIQKKVKVGKNEYKFTIQPRIEMGMVKMRFKTPYLEGKAWVGVNGNQELQVEKKLKATQTKAEVNYFIEQKRVLARVDQHLARHLSLRLTHDRIEGGGTAGEYFENNIVQLRFGMGF